MCIPANPCLVLAALAKNASGSEVEWMSKSSHPAKANAASQAASTSEDAPVLLDFTYNCMKYKHLARDGHVQYTFYSSAKSSPTLAAASRLAVPIRMPSKAARAALQKAKSGKQDCTDLETYPQVMLLDKEELQTKVDKAGTKFATTRLVRKDTAQYHVPHMQHCHGAVWTIGSMQAVPAYPLGGKKRPRAPIPPLRRSARVAARRQRTE